MKMIYPTDRGEILMGGGGLRWSGEEEAMGHSGIEVPYAYL